jgi:hypothetical protein
VSRETDRDGVTAGPVEAPEGMESTLPEDAPRILLPVDKRSRP